MSVHHCLFQKVDGASHARHCLQFSICVFVRKFLVVHCLLFENEEFIKVNFHIKSCRHLSNCNSSFHNSGPKILQLRGGGAKEPILCRIKKGGMHFEAMCVAGISLASNLSFCKEVKVVLFRHGREVQRRKGKQG